MSTVIKYKNHGGIEVNIQEIKELDRYDEWIFENDALKKIYSYYNRKIDEVSIFLNENESLSDFAIELKKADRALIYSNREEINGFSVWKQKRYHDNVLHIGYAKVVFDSLYREVASQYFNVLDKPIPGIYKTFHFGGKPIVIDDYHQGYFEQDCNCNFIHQSDGKVTIYPTTGAMDEPYYSIEYFLKMETGCAMLNLMSNEEIAYYTSPETLIPGFTVDWVLTTQELIQKYQIAFTNKGFQFDPDPNYYNEKIPKTSNDLLTMFLSVWDNPEEIEETMFPKLNGILKGTIDHGYSDAHNVYVGIQRNETRFEIFKSTAPDFIMPTRDFYDVLVLWCTFLLEPPLSGSQVEPETKPTNKLRSFFQFWRKP